MQACAMQADLTLIPSTCMGVCVCGGGGGVFSMLLRLDVC
jgi:hypothetical protein